MTFKEIAADDINDVFFDDDEFSSYHMIDGKKMRIVMDENELIERSAHWEGGAKQSFDTGLYKAQRLFYVPAADFGPRPKIGKLVLLDDKPYVVADCTEESGVYAITIERNRQ